MADGVWTNTNTYHTHKGYFAVFFVCFWHERGWAASLVVHIICCHIIVMKKEIKSNIYCMSSDLNSETYFPWTNVKGTFSHDHKKGLVLNILFPSLMAGGPLQKKTHMIINHKGS